MNWGRSRKQFRYRLVMCHDGAPVSDWVQARSIAEAERLLMPELVARVKYTTALTADDVYHSPADGVEIPEDKWITLEIA